jgi:phosphatidylinositol dimannoside acyltransferase
LSEESRAETAVVYIYRAVAWAGRNLPEHTGRLLFRWCALAAHALFPRVRERVAANQGQVLGRDIDDPLVRACTRDAFVSYSRYWYDAFHATELTERDMKERYRIEGEEHFTEAFAKGSGLIVAMPHCGNWDVGGRWLQVRGYPMTTVAEKLKPERLYELFVQNREALGMDVVPLVSGAEMSRRLTKALAANRLVALLADRDLTGRGIEVELFGRTTMLPTGPAMLALSSGAPIVVVGIFEEGDGWLQVIGPTIVAEPSGDRRADVVALTKRIAAEFERIISAAPANWHMFQPGWPEGTGE